MGCLTSRGSSDITGDAGAGVTSEITDLRHSRAANHDIGDQPEEPHLFLVVDSSSDNGQTDGSDDAGRDNASFGSTAVQPRSGRQTFYPPVNAIDASVGDAVLMHLDALG